MNNVKLSLIIIMQKLFIFRVIFTLAVVVNIENNFL